MVDDAGEAVRSPGKPGEPDASISTQPESPATTQAQAVDSAEQNSGQEELETDEIEFTAPEVEEPASCTATPFPPSRTDIRVDGNRIAPGQVNFADAPKPGLAIDANSDDRLDVLIPTAGRDEIVALTRSAESQGWVSIGSVRLDGVLTTNLSSQSVEGRTTVAVGVGNTIVIMG